MEKLSSKTIIFEKENLSMLCYIQAKGMILQTEERNKQSHENLEGNKWSYNYRNTKCDQELHKAKMYNEMKAFNASFNSNFKY